MKVNLKNFHNVDKGLNEGVLYKALSKENPFFTIAEIAETIAYKCGIHKPMQVKAFIYGFVIAYNNYDFFLPFWKKYNNLLFIAKGKNLVEFKGIEYKNFKYQHSYYIEEV